LCLQETKAFENQIPVELKYTLRDYDYIWHTGTRPGYAGTTIFYKKNLDIISTKNTFPEFPKFDEDGRVVELNFKYNNKEIVLLNIYFPN
jgi:exonuclease III